MPKKSMSSYADFLSKEKSLNAKIEDLKAKIKEYKDIKVTLNNSFEQQSHDAMAQRAIDSLKREIVRAQFQLAAHHAAIRNDIDKAFARDLNNPVKLAEERVFEISKQVIMSDETAQVVYDSKLDDELKAISQIFDEDLSEPTAVAKSTPTPDFLNDDQPMVNSSTNLLDKLSKLLDRVLKGLRSWFHTNKAKAEEHDLLDLKSVSPTQHLGFFDQVHDAKHKDAVEETFNPLQNPPKGE